MWKSALVGAFVLTAMSGLSVTRDGIAVTEASAQETASAVVITEASISRIKHALHLSPAQEVHWRAVEATLRGFMRGARAEDRPEGLVQRVRAKIGSYIVSAAAAHEVAVAARPLIQSLDEQQKQDGLDAMRTLGVASLF